MEGEKSREINREVGQKDEEGIKTIKFLPDKTKE